VTSGWFGGADVHAVNGVSSAVAEGETIGIVGESAVERPRSARRSSV
jgi:ABC-type glutathione transport system ATPase component